KTVTAVKQAEKLAQELQDKSVATGHLVYGLTVDKSVCLHHIFADLNVDPDMFSGYVKTLPREPEVSNGPFNRHVLTAFQRARQQEGRARAPRAGADVGEGGVVLRDAEGVLDRPRVRDVADHAGDGPASRAGARVVLMVEAVTAACCAAPTRSVRSRRPAAPACARPGACCGRRSRRRPAAPRPCSPCGRSGSGRSAGRASARCATAGTSTAPRGGTPAPAPSHAGRRS